MAGTSVLRFICVFLLMLLFVSCVGIHESSDVPDNTKEEQYGSYSTWQDMRIPIIERLELPPAAEVVPPPVPEPSWMPSTLPWWVWIADSPTELPIFLGTSFPMVSRADELERCIMNAAVQAAQYAGIAAQASSFRGTFREGTGFAEDVRLYYNEKLIPYLINEAEIRTLHQDQTGSYALIRFPSLMSDSASAENPDVNVLAGTSEPDWVSRIPGIDGYFLGLGVSRPRIRFADSIAEADKAALAEILLQIAAELDVSYDVSTGNGINSSVQEDIYQRSSAIVRGLRIIARWRNPEGSYFYSLAILPRN